MTTINEAISDKELLNEVATLQDEALTRHLSQSELRIRFNQRFRRVNVLAEEEAAALYEQATDGCRRSVLGARDNARQWQRVKPDEETNFEVLFDCDKEPIRKWLKVTTAQRVHRTDRIGLQAPSLFAPPTGTDGAAGM